MKPPKIMKQKLEVSSGTSTWMNKETLIFFGGTRPPIGNGGRAIVIYSSNEQKIIFCALENCVVRVGQYTDGCIIVCDKCKRDIHKFCDAKIKKKKKLPKEYICPECFNRSKKSRGNK